MEADEITANNNISSLNLIIWPLQMVMYPSNILPIEDDFLNLLPNWFIYAYGAFVVAFFALLYCILIPANIKRDCSSRHLDSRPRSHLIPPVYPNGWIPIAESIQVKGKSFIRTNVHAHQVILLRSEDGKVHCYDAFCPHLGADLGVGGEVKVIAGSTCITCPFHSWTFKIKDGSCISVPYAKEERPPRGVGLKKWQSLERSGFIYVWFHAENEEPSWWPPAVSQIESGEWTYGGRSENVVNCHLQEIPENGADIGHFMPVHSVSAATFSYFGSYAKSFLSSFILGHHQWNANWSPPGDDSPKHIANLNIHQTFHILGRPLMTLVLETKQIGPCTVYLFFTCDQLNLSGILIQGVVPLDCNKQKIVHQVFMKQDIKGRLFSRILLLGEANMVDRDCIMWQHKKFLKNPTLVKEEKSIAKFRLWYSQFYSENSPKTFTSSLLDW